MDTKLDVTVLIDLYDDKEAQMSNSTYTASARPFVRPTLFC